MKKLRAIRSYYTDKINEQFGVDGAFLNDKRLGPAELGLLYNALYLRPQANYSVNELSQYTGNTANETNEILNNLNLFGYSEITHCKDPNKTESEQKWVIQDKIEKSIV
ncbi:MULTISPECIES: hypothetical protein [Leptospira]|uniref:Uncharacterized protein n=1 Tax=Leptospira weilii str. 2006001853 TaxID=1001589 RepID=A0A828YW98_9LEPT|nr:MULTISPECIES: hypothetical protein [Leptospira]EKR63051.1 hypothetical protein LEP1GSC036_0919 [Leptospira weilii str. 2006001853]EMJ61789.1 hypothetical protein LEP1GSC051_0247 [Leptospira sp. P2653]MCL8267594.1 hypothetical protein [Leptospira weilii]OMI16184.1 hypothetical protein BUQ74_16815 [Leptospira weilii serovar Heyan]QDK25273.1 hypothetical protein FHG67_21555 [Leptospira weilii]